MDIRKFRYRESNLMETAFAIRQKVFIEEQHVPYDLERDEHDKTAIHFLLYHDNKAVATARYRRTSAGIKLERFAVLREHRNLGTGSAILSFVLDDLIPSEEKIYLNSQERAVPFYERHGFVKTGEPFMEAGIRHFLMIYNS